MVFVSYISARAFLSLTLSTTSEKIVVSIICFLAMLYLVFIGESERPKAGETALGGVEC